VQDHRAAWLGALGGLNLFLYGILSTLQLETASFGRVTVYGSVCVAMSLA
jgi:drug/metabolite transporter superfamily protein YnfA